MRSWRRKQAAEYLIFLLVLFRRGTASRAVAATKPECGPAAAQCRMPKQKIHAFRQLPDLDVVFKDYDKRAWPTYGQALPTYVTVNIRVNTLGPLNANDMDFDMDMYLRQAWKDPRIIFRNHGVNRTLTLNGEHISSRMWKPDLFFANAKDTRLHSVTMANELVRISPDGDVLFSLRLTVKLSCVMNFHNFPFDKQKCYALIRSYAHTINNTVLIWSDTEPVILETPIEMQDFDLVRLAHTSFTTELDTGAFSTLRIGFIFGRQNGFHLIQTYLPTFIVVIVSWLALWVRPDFIPPRAILGVKTVLTIASIIMSVSTHFPNVSYNKAIDVWMIACIVQVIGVLVEFGIANYLVRSKLSRIDQLKALSPFRKTPWGPSKVSRNEERALRLDRLSRWMFPALFMGFNIIYWSLYLTVPEPDLDDQ